jgi:hypothetical protein
MTMGVQIKGSGPNGNIEAQIDPTYQGVRTTTRPLDHRDNNGNGGGHFMITAISGTIAASLAANSELFSMRWTDGSKRFALIQLSAGLGVYTAAQTVANPLELEAVIARNFTVDYTTNATRISPAPGSQKARGDNMNDTLLANVNGSSIFVCTTTGMTGSTKTLDTAGVGFATYPGNAVGAAATYDLFRIVENAKHPIILKNNEGIVIRNSGAFGAAATFKLGVTMVWAEIPTY